MREPNEKWLDQHFKEQLHEYEPALKHEACKTDLPIIKYWLEILKAAPPSQKWARNGLLLLMYGQLKEMGCLQVPFTDMHNMGRNLNEVLDGYEGLPVHFRHKATQILLPKRKEQQCQSEPKDFEILRQLKEQERSLGNGSQGGILRHSSQGATGEAIQMLYDTFDSHVCYKTESEAKIFQELNTAFNALKVKRPPVAPFLPLASIPETPSCSNRTEKPSCSKVLRGKRGEVKPKDSHVTFNLPPYKEKTEERCHQSSAPDPGRVDGSEAELMYLRRRNKQLRRECLIYYNRQGQLRRCPKYPKSKVHQLGFQLGAYRAHFHFTHWQQQSNQPNYFHQEYDRTNGWRTYRRILLASSVPRARLRGPLDTKRQCTLQRMSHILRLKHIYTEHAAGQLSGQELQCLLKQLEGKYLALADHLKSEPHPIVD